MDGSKSDYLWNRGLEFGDIAAMDSRGKTKQQLKLFDTVRRKPDPLSVANRCMRPAQSHRQERDVTGGPRSAPNSHKSDMELFSVPPVEHGGSADVCSTGSTGVPAERAGAASAEPP